MYDFRGLATRRQQWEPVVGDATYFDLVRFSGKFKEQYAHSFQGQYAAKCPKSGSFVVGLASYDESMLFLLRPGDDDDCFNFYKFVEIFVTAARYGESTTAASMMFSPQEKELRDAVVRGMRDYAADVSNAPLDALCLVIGHGTHYVCLNSAFEDVSSELDWGDIFDLD